MEKLTTRLLVGYTISVWTDCRSARRHAAEASRRGVTSSNLCLVRLSAVMHPPGREAFSQQLLIYRKQKTGGHCLADEKQCIDAVYSSFGPRVASVHREKRLSVWREWAPTEEIHRVACLPSDLGQLLGCLLAHCRGGVSAIGSYGERLSSSDQISLLRPSSAARIGNKITESFLLSAAVKPAGAADKHH